MIKVREERIYCDGERVAYRGRIRGRDKAVTDRNSVCVSECVYVCACVCVTERERET